MPAQKRDLGTITQADTQKNTVQVWDFIRLIIPAPVGTIYLTNKPCDSTGLIHATICGITADWKEYDVNVGLITANAQTSNSINVLKIGNLAAFNGFADKQFTKWANSPGLRGAKVALLKGQFDPVTGTLTGSYPKFYGEFDGGQFDDEATITVKTDDTPWAKQAPRARIASSCVSIYRSTDCGFVGAEPVGQVTCNHSRAACIARSNEINFLGFDLKQSPGTQIHWTVYTMSEG